MEKQSVVAYVPIEGEMNWILASVIRKNTEEQTYLVEDIVEESPGQRRVSYTVPANRVAHFPQHGVSYKVGDRVLAVWYETSTQNWTSILYPATILEAYPSTEIPDSVVVKVRYDGDPKVSYINALWVIKAPECD